MLGRKSWSGLLILVASLLWTGCSASTRTVVPFDERPLPALSESREELLARLLRLQQGISTLTGTEVTFSATGLGLTTGVLAEYRDTEGALFVERPDHIHMQGKALLGVTVFDMVSDRETFQVSLPTRNEFIMGEADSVTCSENPILNLRPQHIMDSLFIDVSPYLEDAGVTHTLEAVFQGRQSFYVLSFIDVSNDPASLLEKIWIDRLDLSVIRKQLFGEEGTPHTNVTYSEWEETDGDLFPRQILVERPAEDYSLAIRFRGLRTNDAPSENAFVLAEPPGARRVVLESDPEECRD